MESWDFNLFLWVLHLMIDSSSEKVSLGLLSIYHLLRTYSFRMHAGWVLSSALCLSISLIILLMNSRSYAFVPNLLINSNYPHLPSFFKWFMNSVFSLFSAHYLSLLTLILSSDEAYVLGLPLFFISFACCCWVVLLILSSGILNEGKKCF